MTPKYILIEEPSAQDFTDKMNDLLSKGYCPSGDFKKQDGMFYQMMEHKNKSEYETKDIPSPPSPPAPRRISEDS